MLRGLSCLVVSCALACSSSTTNESGSGGSSTGGSSTGGSSTGSSSTGGSSGGGGSAGSSSGGSGGQSNSCPWVDCGIAVKTSACDGAFNACKISECDGKVAAYAQCVCSGKTDCLLPDGPAALNLINCLAKDPALSPKCFGVQCVDVGGACSTTGVGEHCCEGTNCVGSKCV